MSDDDNQDAQEAEKRARPDDDAANTEGKWPHKQRDSSTSTSLTHKDCPYREVQLKIETIDLTYSLPLLCSIRFRTAFKSGEKYRCGR
jgi:hypothetical protein